MERASAPGRGLRFSVSMSFYHAGSKRFYGDTFIGDGLDEGDEARVEIISETSKGGESKVLMVRSVVVKVSRSAIFLISHVS